MGGEERPFHGAGDKSRGQAYPLGGAVHIDHHVPFSLQGQLKYRSRIEN